jgi:hypothetical protein
LFSPTNAEKRSHHCDATKDSSRHNVDARVYMMRIYMHGVMQRVRRACLARYKIFFTYEKNISRKSVQACCNFMRTDAENATKA